MANVIHFDEDSALSQFLDIFWSKGYKATTIRELARSAGISESSLFKRFRSKREIHNRSLCRYHEMTKSRRKVMEDEESALVGIRKYWQALADLIADPSRTRGCMINNATVEQTGNPDIAAFLKTVHKDYEKSFKKTLDRAARQGEIKPDADTRALAHFLTNNAQGLRLLSRINPGRTVVQNVDELTMGTLDSYRAGD